MLVSGAVRLLPRAVPHLGPLGVALASTPVALRAWNPRARLPGLLPDARGTRPLSASWS